MVTIGNEVSMVGSVAMVKELIVATFNPKERTLPSSIVGVNLLASEGSLPC